MYYLKNVELNVEKLPPFFPEKSGMFNSIILDRQEPLYGVKLYFHILKTFKKNWKKLVGDGYSYFISLHFTLYECTKIHFLFDK